MPRAMLVAVMVIGIVATWRPSPASAQERLACAEVDGFQRLDFWVGEWEVVAGEERVGTNRIEKILEGCAIMEHWRGAGGSEGRSLFYYNHVTDAWKQVWVTGNATMPGGLKEKSLVETLADGSLRFEGAVPLPGGRTYLDRTTLSPLADGRVRQVIEISLDGGATWQARFDAVYVPVASLPRAGAGG